MARSLARRLVEVFSFAKPLLETMISLEAKIAEAWAAGAYHRLYLVQWGMLPKPEFFCHKIDLYWQWRETRTSHWLERGVFSTLAIKPEAVLLELGCGDGFNTYFFYGKKAKEIVAIDFDPVPLNYARRNFSASNIDYRLADMLSQMPKGDFDNVVWDAVFAYFTEAQVDGVMLQITDRLRARAGTLSGTTQVKRDDGRKHTPGHVYECKSKEDLFRFLRPHFKNVSVFETVFSDRRNLYFWASDGVLPFSTEWPFGISQ